MTPSTSLPGEAMPQYEMHATGMEGVTEGTERMEVSMGPHHPSTHGVFRMDVEMEGETITKLKPVFGYLHRNHEKIAEGTSYLGSMPYTDRLDISIQ